jgi:hypothetical protein
MGHYRQLRRVYDFPKLPYIGTLYHRGLEKYYKGEEVVPQEFVAQETIGLMEKNPNFATEIEEVAVWAKIMLEGYFEWLEESGSDANLKVIGVEEAVVVQVEEFTLRGKIDARVKRRSDGALLQLEHKTVGGLGDLPKTAQTNQQFLTYDLLAFMTKPDGVPTDGVLLNMARRVKRTKAAKPPFYGRHEVRHTVDELRNHYKHVAGLGRQMSEARQRLDDGESFHVVCPPSQGREHEWKCICSRLGSMFDDGSDYEAYLEEFYEVHDPMERYAPEEEA